MGLQSGGDQKSGVKRTLEMSRIDIQLGSWLDTGKFSCESESLLHISLNVHVQKV